MDEINTAISIRDVKKRFGDFIAISGMSFNIRDNEFFTLLGPSGCGKTTLLRMIAGFENTSEGEIHLYGQPLENLTPNERPVNTVFQSYALFPHMNVAKNIGFGLHMLGWSKAEIQERVEQMIKTVELHEFAHRKPAQLSGGQQQRVALARAMAPKPKVLLLDEPLSALDLKLRQQMRAELKALQKTTGITFIFVTHDQEEALTMSDRIAVMSAGEVQQIGTPTEVYEQPANRFVAEFIGKTNLIEATVTEVQNDSVVCKLVTGQTINAVTAQNHSEDSSGVSPSANIIAGAQGHISLRPEQLSITEVSSSSSGLQGTLGEAMYLGTDTQFDVNLSDNVCLTVRRQNSVENSNLPEFGEVVELSVAQGAARFLAG